MKPAPPVTRMRFRVLNDEAPVAAGAVAAVVTAALLFLCFVPCRTDLGETLSEVSPGLVLLAALAPSLHLRALPGDTGCSWAMGSLGGTGPSSRDAQHWGASLICGASGDAAFVMLARTRLKPRRGRCRCGPAQAGCSTWPRLLLVALITAPLARCLILPARFSGAGSRSRLLIAGG